MTFTDLRGQLAVHPTKRYTTRPLAGVRWIVIHHVAAPVQWDISEIEAAKGVATYHVNVNDWPGAGYAFYVGRDGGVYQLNDLETMCYNVASLNDKVMGIVLEGDFTILLPTGPQLLSTHWLIGNLETRMPQAEVRAHKEIALPEYATACCGDTYTEWQPEITR